MTYYSKFQEDVVSSATPPASPVPDQLWWKLPEQTLYIWDDVGKTWVLNRAIAANDPTKAPLASPVFTGNPQAPTPSPGDADTSIATTAFVKNALDSDTSDWSQVLNKPATYPPTLPITQADVTDLVADLGLKAPKDNPIFTGTPKAPTPPPGDNDTSIATTAFVALASTGLFPGGTINQYLRGDKSWQTLNKAAVGLGNVDNTADLDKPVSTQQANADALRVLKSGDTMSGALTISPPNATAQLNLLALGSHDTGIIFSTDSTSSSAYLESRTGTSTRWQIFLGDNVAEIAAPNDAGGTNFSLRRFRNDGVFLGDVLTVLRSDGVVNFTVGATAPTPLLGDSSTKVATTAFVVNSIGAKEPTISPGTVSQYWRGDKTWQTHDKTSVGLGNVDNTSDISKPISTATQAVLDLKAPINNPVFTGKVTTAASIPTLAGLRLPHGVNPTTPINGDLWSTSAGFYGMVNGVIVGPMGPGIQGVPGPKGDKGDKGDPGPQGSQVMYIGDGPPAVPIVGQTWFESDTGNSYIYYDDGNSSQWVTTHVGTLPGAGGPTVAWADITGKPATYPPTLPIAQSGITNLTTDLAGKAPTVHTHVQSDITGLAATLSGKSDTGHTHAYSSLTGIPATFPATAHIHTFADVTGLQAALDAKAGLASPIFTGDPRAPTPLPGDNDTSVATTAFVVNAITQVITGGGTAAVFVGDGPPVSPIIGQLWWDSDNGNLFLYYDDGNGPPQWVSSHVGLPATTAGGASGGGIEEAPTDGKLYARKSGTWDELNNDFNAKANIADPVFTGDVYLTGFGSLMLDAGAISFGYGFEAQIACDGVGEIAISGFPVSLDGPVKLNNADAGLPTTTYHLTNKGYVDGRIVQLTQAAYTALAVKVADVLYVIIG